MFTLNLLCAVLQEDSLPHIYKRILIWTAYRSVEHIVCLWSHVFVTGAEWGLAVPCWNVCNRYWKRCCLHTGWSPFKIQNKCLSISGAFTNIHPILPQMVAFASFYSNCLNALSLAHGTKCLFFSWNDFKVDWTDLKILSSEQSPGIHS